MKTLLNLSFLFLAIVSMLPCVGYGQDLSPMAKHLKQLVEEGNTGAILEAAATGDVTLIPYLKQLCDDVKQRSNFNHRAFFAHIALAKLGDAEAVREIMAEVDSESPAVQDSAMRKLSLIGGKVAFKRFYELLDETKPRENTDCLKMFEEQNRNPPEDPPTPFCHVVYWSKSFMAMFFLRKMVDDPPFKHLGSTSKEIGLWKEWFGKRKSLID